MKFRFAFSLIALIFLCGCAATDSKVEPSAGPSVAPTLAASPTPPESQTPTAVELPSAAPETPVIAPTPEAPEPDEPSDYLEPYFQAVYDACPDAGQIELIALELDETGEITADFNCDGVIDTLIYAAELPELEASYVNNPLLVTLTIGDVQLEFKSEWNDGLYLGIADFDKSDEFVEIVIVETGTDIGCGAFVYRLFGSELMKRMAIPYVFADMLFYDGEGTVYFFELDDPAYLKAFDCKDSW